MTYAFKCINLIPYMLIWAMFDCRYKLDQIRASWCKLEGVKEKNRGAGAQSSRLDWDIQQTQLESNILDSKAKTPEFKSRRFQLTGW